MFSAGELEGIPYGLEKLFYGLNSRIMLDIVRRLKANAGEITRAADWQIYRANQLGTAKSEIKKFIAETLKLADDEIDRIYESVLDKDYVRAREVYEKTGAQLVPYDKNETLLQLVGAIRDQTRGELHNITGTLGVAASNKSKTAIVSLTQYYEQTLDGAVLDVASGAFDYDTVLRRIVRELTNSGIRHIDYESAQGRPTSARIEVAARRALMTGIGQLTGKISEQNAQALGTDMYEVSTHSGCRPTHLSWQGGWYTMAQLHSVCGYGDVAGLKGANCRHDFYPVIPGIDEPSYTAEELAEIRRKELTPHEYMSKEYTAYEATQRQRELERTMRARRESIKLLSEGGADEKSVIKERASYRALSQEYTRFSKAMGLPEQRQRVTVDGLGNVGVGKYKSGLTNAAEKSIIDSGGDELSTYKRLGKLNQSLLLKEFGSLQTDRVIITNERLEHIRQHHPEDVRLFERYGKQAVTDPDLILKDEKNEGTVFMIVKTDVSNINAIVRLALESDEDGRMNSVMTFYRIRDKNLNKLKKRLKTLYKRE